MDEMWAAIVYEMADSGNGCTGVGYVDAGARCGAPENSRHGRANLDARKTCSNERGC